MTFAQPAPEPPSFCPVSSHLIKFKKMFAAAAGLLLCLAAMPVQANDAVVEGKSNWLFAGWESLTTAKPEAEKASLRLISETATLFAEKNIKLIVVVVPLKPRYYEAQLPDGAAMSDLVRGRYDRLLTDLRIAGIKAPDVRDALRTVLAGKKEVFYRTDFHWTTFASEATADLVADSITAEGPLPGKPGSGAPLGEWMSDRHLGDLAANFLSPERKRAIGPEAYFIRAAIKPAAGLLDADPSPVAVVGNSFVQPYFGFPQRLSNKIDRPIALKWNAGDIGPWATLLQCLQSTEFMTPSVRYLVWQFNEAQIQNGPDAVGEWAPQSISSPAAWRAKLAGLLKIDEKLNFP
ncbi:twin-arginine translocation pathway signal [Bradyrhizobium sp. CCGUVB14]|uniref:alginate O-acetyltransferase AlgX-related protein n=1 Tax=Bradyrhizobium sp. CCGUVB14 TaxID=2949628 RepID=UPI0020B451CB|nr:twin-arginine translocation pathway signal [Bradyrhizobium sp. CCGUVB14]MCP3442071.1 twin-arginine translocation pathway signal [Bradyrhizobium sp. CCGUVB14]